MKESNRTILLRLRLAFVGTLVLGLATLYRIGYLQLIQGTYWREKARVASLDCRPLKASRGNIYTAKGAASPKSYLLSTSLPLYRVALDPSLASEEVFEAEVGPLAKELANFFQDKPASAYAERMRWARKTGKRYLILNRHKVYHRQKKLMEQWPLFAHGRYRGGVLFEKAEERFKPFRGLAERTIGFINDNGRGAGLEISFDKALKGIPGQAIYRKALGGHWQTIPHEDNVRPVHGYDIYTTLDINIQDLTHTALHQALLKNEAAYGCAIVMEVKTGNIKAMVNLQRAAPDRYREMYNYALGPQGCCEPGSTFKVPSMMAILEEMSLPLDHPVDVGPGFTKVYDRTIRDVSWRCRGPITLQQVIEYSSNVGMAKLVEQAFGHQPQRFIDYLTRFGLTQPLQLQLQGAAPPLVKSPNDPSWSGTTLPWMAFGGYELEVSPLQLLTFYNAIANDGHLVHPLLVQQLRYANRVVRTYKPHVQRKKICSDATLAKIRTMLEGVVLRGAGHRVASKHYTVAGKTGTEQIYTRAGYTDKAHYVSFIAYFPADKPRYSCLVALFAPKGERVYGGTMAAPVVRAIADRLFVQDPTLHPALPPTTAAAQPPRWPHLHRGLREDWLQICRQLQLQHTPPPSTPWVQPQPTEDGLSWRTHSPKKEDVLPDLRGMTLKDALYLLENKGFAVQWSGRGRVRSQSLPPGLLITPGETITLQLR